MLSKSGSTLSPYEILHQIWLCAAATTCPGLVGRKEGSKNCVLAIPSDIQLSAATQGLIHVVCGPQSPIPRYCLPTDLQSSTNVVCNANIQSIPSVTIMHLSRGQAHGRAQRRARKGNRLDLALSCICSPMLETSKGFPTATNAVCLRFLIAFSTSVAYCSCASERTSRSGKGADRKTYIISMYYNPNWSHSNGVRHSRTKAAWDRTLAYQDQRKQAAEAT